MNRLDNLTLRTTTALGRLAMLQRRADKTSSPPSLVRDALEELNTALEELRAANEALAEHASDIAAARERDLGARRELQALLSAMPIACVFTDNTGQIVDANPHASRLLNVGRQHLVGKPLFLFFTERDRFLDALAVPPASGEFEQVSIVRPRERRPREVQLKGVRLPSGDRWCWFLDQRLAPQEVE
jgi:PAS domain-containing protein